MRTVILVGFVFLAQAVRTVPVKDTFGTLIAIVFIAAVIMDVAEFVKKLSK